MDGRRIRYSPAERLTCEHYLRRMPTPTYRLPPLPAVYLPTTYPDLSPRPRRCAPRCLLPAHTYHTFATCHHTYTRTPRATVTQQRYHTTFPRLYLIPTLHAPPHTRTLLPTLPHSIPTVIARMPTCRSLGAAFRAATGTPLVDVGSCVALYYFPAPPCRCCCPVTPATPFRALPATARVPCLPAPTT